MASFRQYREFCGNLPVRDSLAFPTLYRLARIWGRRAASLLLPALPLLPATPATTPSLPPTGEAIALLVRTPSLLPAIVHSASRRRAREATRSRILFHYSLVMVRHRGVRRYLRRACAPLPHHLPSPVPRGEESPRGR